VTEHEPGRYSCHDLLRAYAHEQAHLHDPEAERRAAIKRMLTHYIHSADHADRLIDPRREEPPALTELPPGVSPERAADRARALAWFDAELRILLAAAHQDAEFDVQVCELVWVTRRFLAHQGHWHDEVDALTVALAAARRLGDPIKQAFAHCYLGCTYVWFGSYDDARTQLDRALDLYREAGDRIGQAYVEHYYSWLLEQQKRNAEALSHAEQALALFLAAGHRAGQAKVLNAVGWFHTQTGNHRAAIDYCQRALTLQTELGDPLGAGQTWHSLGYAHQQLGDYGRAVSCYQAAVDLFRESGYLFNEAHTLTSLGDAHENAGDLEAARTVRQKAFDILDRLRHPDADKALAKLKELSKSLSETREASHERAADHTGADR
jgi:tetratricopeptide (TPR) repeat protein